MTKSLDNIKLKIEILIESIEKMGKSRNDIANHLGMKTASINSALSRGGSEELYNKIDSYYKYLKVKETENYNIAEAIKKIEAMNTVMLTAMSEVIASQKGKLSAPIKKELEKMVAEQLSLSL